MRPSGARRRRIAAGAAAFAGLAAGLLACGGAAGTTGRDVAGPLRAKVDTAVEIPWSSRYEVTAGVLAFRRATLGTVLLGRVDEVLRREGDRVAAGEVLARVESRDVAARLAQAEAAVAAARALEENARLTQERMERLAARQAASQKSLEDAVSGHRAAAANLQAAEEGVKAARVYVAYSEVTAPWSGVVVEKRVEVGDTAAPGSPLFVLEDTSKVKVEATVPESALAGLRSGDAVEVSIDAAGGVMRRGRLSEILPAADPGSRTFTVRAILKNQDGALRSGMFARLRLPGPGRTTLAVPATALVARGPLNGLYVLDASGVARLRWVTIGESRDDRVEVLTGLGAGERYVLSPPPGIEDGRAIEVD
ncbi:MAG TPA: efflux RND transporter periplasmic adaptor subunit [Candidatus Polarisedimenticolia bacterium]|nr:efflux RND transporter periplasmic adaptor subunit [Candidatus Polarisedimenticolia bacterium]